MRTASEVTGHAGQKPIDMGQSVRRWRRSAAAGAPACSLATRCTGDERDGAFP
jgi:hypothetical protein